MCRTLLCGVGVVARRFGLADHGLRSGERVGRLKTDEWRRGATICRNFHTQMRGRVRPH